MGREHAQETTQPLKTRTEIRKGVVRRESEENKTLRPDETPHWD